MRVFKEQVKALTRNIASLFIPVLQAILPPLTAIVMVLNELITMLLSFFDIDYESFWKGMSSGAYDLSDGIGEISKSAEDAMKGLRSFDKLNVINTPKASDKSSGLGVGGLQVDKQLQDALEEYDLQLEGIQTRAQKIRDSIMEWLGFSKDINGEWKFTHFTLGTLLGGLVGVGGVIWAITNVIGKFKILKSLFNGIKSLAGVKTTRKALDELSNTSSATKKFKLPDAKTILKGLEDLALIIGGIILVIEAINLLTKIPGFKSAMSNGLEALKEIFTGLGKIAIPLSYASLLVGVMGNIGVGTFAKGLADFAIIVGGIPAIITAIGALSSISYVKTFISTGIDMMKKVFTGLYDMAIPLGLFSAYIIGLGIANPVTILSGLAGMALIIDGTAVVLASLGALYSLPTFKEFVNGGGELLITMFEILGRTVGAVVEGFVGQATSNLGQVGENLSEFMINAQPFFEGATKISSESLEGVNKLSSIILKLTASNILEGLFGWVTGGSSIVKFGKDLSEFAPYFSKYAESIKGIDSKVVTASANAALSLANFAKNLPKENGLWQKIIGQGDMQKFAKNLPELGKNLKQYSVNVSGLDADVVKNSSEAAKSIAEFAKTIPNEGGMVAWFTGDNQLDKWSNMLPTFGKNLKSYSDYISGLDNNIIINSANAAKSIVEIAKNIPNEGGIKAWFTGENNIEDFGRYLANFGYYFSGYYENIKNVDLSRINSMTAIIGDIVNLAKTIKSQGINDVMSDFAKKLSTSSSYFNNFFSKTNATAIGTNYGNSLANAIADALKKKNFPTIEIKFSFGNSTLNKLLGGGGFRAGGGFVNTGEMFVAREAGPELVGRIGSRTAVANNDQIVSAVSDGVTNAILRAGGLGGKNPIIIQATGDTDGLMNFITFKQQEKDMQFGN